MATVYYDADATLDALAGMPIGLIGYGNQGRAHALNLRESGLIINIGARPASNAHRQALADGFEPRPIAEIAASSSLLAIMLPDEVIPQVYQTDIEPHLKPQPAFVFAHGFCVHFDTVQLPRNADILLVAPTGPGRQVRSLFTQGKGLPALVAVKQDVSGKAWGKCLAYARGIGCTRAGAIKTTFAEETVTDLYCEQSVLCGGMPALIKASFETLVQRGYQPELAYISCLKEVKLIADLLFNHGIYGMRSAISNTAKFGSAKAGPRLIDQSTKQALEDLLSDIESGTFACKFLEESAAGSPVTNELLQSEKRSKLQRIGNELKEILDF